MGNILLNNLYNLMTSMPQLIRILTITKSLNKVNPIKLNNKAKEKKNNFLKYF